MKKPLKCLVSFFAIWLAFHTVVIIVAGLSDNVSESDAILIFGNKVETSGVPSKRLQSRLDEGAALYKQGMAPLIIVSGGFGKEGYDEAEVMKAYLVEKGLPENVIIEDGEGDNTYLTAKNLKEIAEDKEIKSVIIVSQYYHILRAKLTVKKFGFDTVYSSQAKMFPEFRDLYAIPREIAGYYSYLFKDYS